MSEGSLLIWTSASASHPGKVRKVNEDSCLELPELGLWAVADGMGGHKAGDVASSLIVDFLSRMDEPADLGTFVQAIKQRLNEVNGQLRTIATQQYETQIIGSTVVGMAAFGGQCAYLWVGDSRIYRFRNGVLQQLSRDHTLVEEYVEQHVISREEAELRPDANVLTRAVGAEDILEVEVEFDELAHDDRFLLCSDGLYREISEEEMADALSEEKDCQHTVQRLLDLALSREAKDNITITVVQIQDAFS